MDALKKFISKKKTDVKFKTAGPGHKLTETDAAARGKPAGSSAGPSSGEPHSKRTAEPVTSVEKRQAAAAALARLEKQKKPTDVNEKDRLAARQLAYIKGNLY